MKVLFVCTGNAARSQMAEALARSLGLDADSAGTDPKDQVHPLAVAVLKEKGIDISHKRPKKVDLTLAQKMDIIVTLCHEAEEECVRLPVKVPIHSWNLPDPAQATGDEEERVNRFRIIADEIERRIQILIESSQKPSP